MNIKDVTPIRMKSWIVPPNSEMIKSHEVLPSPIASGIEISEHWGDIEFSPRIEGDRK